jgi:hypothetical protein
MDSIGDVFFSWQFLLIGVVVFIVFGFFNQFIGGQLWRWRLVRPALRELEGTKLVWPPLIGFALGWVPAIPRPEALVESSQFTVALLYTVAGLCSQWIVKGVKKYIESRGIKIDLDDDPKRQKDLRRGLWLQG